jgi:hypothetical protein
MMTLVIGDARNDSLSSIRPRKKSVQEPNPRTRLGKGKLRREKRD